MRSVKECIVTYLLLWFVRGLESLKYRRKAKHLSVSLLRPKIVKSGVLIYDTIRHDVGRAEKIRRLIGL